MEDAYKASETGASTTSSWGALISGLYVTNDAENLYILLSLKEQQTLYKDDHARFTFYLDNLNKSTAESITETGTWEKGLASTVTFTSTTKVEDEITVTADGSVLSTANTTVSKNWDSFESASENSENHKNPTVLEFSVPLSSIGNAGEVVNLFAGFSKYHWISDGNAPVYLVDLATKEDGLCTTSGEVKASDDWTIYNVSCSLDMSKALSYTIK